MHRTTIRLLTKELRNPPPVLNGQDRYKALKEVAEHSLSLLKLNENVFDMHSRNFDKLWSENNQLFQDLKLLALDLLRMQKVVANKHQVRKRRYIKHKKTDTV